METAVVMDHFCEGLPQHISHDGIVIPNPGGTSSSGGIIFIDVVGDFLQSIRDVNHRGIIAGVVGGTISNGFGSLPTVRAVFEWLEPSSNGKKFLPTLKIITHR